jgi:hypothetical protein
VRENAGPLVRGGIDSHASPKVGDPLVNAEQPVSSVVDISLRLGRVPEALSVIGDLKKEFIGPSFQGNGQGFGLGVLDDVDGQLPYSVKEQGFGIFTRRQRVGLLHT